MDEIRCPKCGAVEDEHGDFVSYWGDQSVDFECRGCGEKLTVREHVERTFTVTAQCLVCCRESVRAPAREM